MVGGIVALDLDFLGKFGDDAGLDHVLGQVDQHRTGPPGPGDMEGLVDGLGQLVDVLHQVVVLGAGPGDADDVHFLEGVVADQGGGHLAGDDHDGDGVQVGRSDAGHRVGGPGAGGHQGHAHLAGGPGIAVRRMDRGLLVAHQDMLDLRRPGELVIDVQDHAPGVAEDVFHLFPFQTFQ